MKRLLVVLVLSLSTTACATGSLPTPEQLARNDFADCPSGYQEIVKGQIEALLLDPPISIMYRFSDPQKYVYQGKFGHFFIVGIWVKYGLGDDVFEKRMHFMCFADGIRQVNEVYTSLINGPSNKWK